MNKRNIIKIINKELTILKDIIDDLSEADQLHPMEIDLALSKAKDVSNTIALLKDSTGISGQPQIKDTTVQRITVDKLTQITDNLQEIESTSILDFEKEEEPKHEPSHVATENKVEIDIPSEPTPVLQTEEPIPVPVKADLTIKQPNTKLVLPINEPEPPKPKPEPIKTEPVAEYTNTENTQQQPFKKSAVSDSKTEPDKSEILADKFESSKISVNDMLASFKKDKNLASLLKDRPVTDLNKAIKINDRIWYIKELFENNNELYTSTIKTLNDLPNLSEALEFLFKRFNWDQNKQSTVSFLELVYRRFSN